MLTNWKKKLVAMFLIFTLTFSNFAIVGKAYASSIFDGIFGSKDTSDTGSSNVEFDAYFFDAQNSQSKEMKSDVNSEDLNLGLTVKVLKGGYLKDAKIILGNGEEVNFKIVNDPKVETEQSSEVNVDTVSGDDNVDTNTISDDSAVNNTVSDDNANVNTTSNNDIDANVTSNNTADNMIASNSGVKAVSNDSDDVGTVSGDSDDVGTVSGDSDDIGTVSGDSDDIGTVSGDSDDVGTVSSNSNDVETVSNTSNDANSISNTTETSNNTVNETMSNTAEGYITDGSENSGTEGNNTGDIVTEEQADEQSSVDFTEVVQNDDNIQAFDGTTLELVQLNANSDIDFSFPIRYENLKYVDESDLSKVNKVKFEGTYIDDDGNEIAVSKTVDLKLTWTDNREIKVNSEITKYIGYSMEGVSGLILQTSVKVDNTTNNKTLPVKNSKVSVGVPVVSGVIPSTVNVVAKSLLGINGKQNDDVIFSNDNWSYDSEKNEIVINVKNEKELVAIQNENEVLKEENALEENLYYNTSGVDEYIITYTYDNIGEEPAEFNSMIKAEYKMFNDCDLAVEQEMHYEVTEKIGDIVTFSTETLTEPISKGYTYLNYNNEQSIYEVEIDNKLIFNISYKDIVDGLYMEDSNTSYVTKTGEVFANNDLYYKRLSISKSNFNEILGEDGFINVYDANGNLLSSINKDMQANENDIYEVELDNSIRWIRIETSKPIYEGNLIIDTVKAYKDVSYGKNDYRNFDKISMNTVGKVKYIYLDNYADCGVGNSEVVLQDTSTKANLELGQDSLSTLAINNNVELKIALNNENIISDVYGNSQFEIKLPEYVTNVEVTDGSIVYGDGLTISNIQVFEDQGLYYIRVDVSGMQNQLSSGIVSHGTNIVLNVDIELDLFTPATEGKIELQYINSEATQYPSEVKGVGYDAKNITYSAPSGLISVNSISNYDGNGSTVTSVKQGNQIKNIDIYSTAKNAKMELTIMNNEPNNVSNIRILGRLPKKDVRDIESESNLKTTLDTAIISEIVPDPQNNTEFRIYYSENPTASADLNDASNGWTETVDNYNNVKSYLIVPVDSNYIMEPTQKIRFSYEFEVPGNLAHNQEIYGAFGTYYTNNTNVGTFDQVSIADLVGLTTGAGPELSINTTLNNTELKEFEELEITTKVKNVGKEVAKEVQLEIPVPKYTSFKNYTSNNENVIANTDSTPLVYQLNELKVGEEVEIKTNVVADSINTGSSEDVQFDVISSVTAKDLDVLMQTDPQVVGVKQADMKVSISDSIGSRVMQPGDEFEVYVNINDLKQEELKNVVTTMKLDSAFELKKAFVQTSSVNGSGETTEVEETPAQYDASTETVTWNCDTIDANITKTLQLNLATKEMAGDITKKDVKFVANTQESGGDSYESEVHTLSVGKPSLTISQTSDAVNSYIKEGETINYKFAIKNEGGATAEGVVIKEAVPKGMVVTSVSYGTNGVGAVRHVTSNSEVQIDSAIKPQETLEVNVEAKAVALGGAKELSVTNSAVVEAKNMPQIKSNEITHIVEATSDHNSVGDTSNGVASSDILGSSSSFLKTYKISGTAWLDANKDGVRTDDEKLMKDVKATLINPDEGVIKQTTLTNSKGEYTFTGVQQGNYIIIFDYDTVLYTVTTYQKENVKSNVNSDVITTKVEQEGKLRNAAVTDVITIQEGSISNIDIGLAEALKFDLSLEVGITKITVQNSQGTTTTPYEGVTLTKTEVGAKQMAGTQIYIEYTFKVKNEGEIDGIAKKIVDYIPEGMNFNSGMNAEWYTGSDGNLYTTSLADTEIKPGETKTLKLVLSRTMTDQNTGNVSNTAEIVEDFNIFGVSDLDSVPANKAQNEDDFGRADALLSVRTGEVFIYISVVITTIILIGVSIFIIVLKVRYRLEKGGVKQ